MKPIRRLHIERPGTPALYKFMVDGVELGSIEYSSIFRGWVIHEMNLICETQEDAENKLIERGLRFGHLK